LQPTEARLDYRQEHTALPVSAARAPLCCLDYEQEDTLLSTLPPGLAARAPLCCLAPQQENHFVAWINSDTYNFLKDSAYRDIAENPYLQPNSGKNFNQLPKR